MFSFFRDKKSAKNPGDYFPFVTDIHSHILPGIDDGSPDVETSIKLVKGLMAMGVTSSIATPHIIGDLYRNNRGTINAALNILQDELKKQKERLKRAAKKTPLLMSGVTGEGVKEALRALVAVIGEAPVSLKAKGSTAQAEPWTPATPQS